MDKPVFFGLFPVGELLYLLRHLTTIDMTVLRKKFLLLTLPALIAFSSQAQFKKGMRMVGSSIGSVLYNSGSSDITVSQIGSSESKITSFSVNISPSLGWFMNENTVVGISLNINPQGTTTSYEQSGSTFQEDKSNSFNFGVGGFVRNYFKSSGALMPFGQLGINAGISNLNTEGFFYGGTGPAAYKDSYDGNSSGGSFANATVQAGFTKMISQLTGLDFFIGYNFSYSKNTFKKTTIRTLVSNGSQIERRENETTTRFTNHGFLLGVGFQVFLARK